MATRVLDSPVVAGAALRSANFFNGRLLTGEDLRREQETSQARLQRLGRATGEGVAHGLEVTQTPGASKTRPVVTVTAGLALCRSGQVVALGADVDLALARTQPTPQSEPGALFADCQPFAPGTYTAGAGVYLLTIAPAQQGEGRAPVSGLANQPAPCNVALSVDAVRFRLIRLALPAAELADKAHLRNRVAYRFLGTDALAAFVRDPFGGAPAVARLIDTLRDQTLHDDEVPLAAIGWSVDDGIRFVDLWPVRRRLVRPEPEGGLAALSGDRRRAEGEARFLQFQAHVADLARTESSIETLDATSAFSRLPAAGLLPLGDLGERGFGFREFFAAVPTFGPVHMGAADVPNLLSESFDHPPIDLAVDEVVRLYLVRENVMPPTADQSVTRQHVLFTSGWIRYRADARFDLSVWNFSNYAEIG